VSVQAYGGRGLGHPIQVVAIAGRVAAAMALTDLDSVWTGRGTECPEDPVELTDIDAVESTADASSCR
jgi:hypothetical protein